MEYCTQCGYEAEEFDQGVCTACCEANQIELDVHNLSFDTWQSLSEDVRARLVGAAIRRGA